MMVLLYLLLPIHCLVYSGVKFTAVFFFAFLAGFDEVFPMEKLFLFSPNELQMILCGDQSPQWTREDIINYTEPKLGYTKDR
jgi:HECT-domain (ubiquitin-transferase)